MANIRLKELLEANVDPKLVARSKESGKLVYFKTQQAKDAALQAGSHIDPSRDKKGAEPKADAKPNDMFGGDYAKDRGTEAPKADVKSIIKGILKTADKEFRKAWDLDNPFVRIANVIDANDEDGKELKARLDKGDKGTYVQTGETGGIVVFNDGTQYELHHVEDGPIPVSKLGAGEAPKASPKKASKSTKSADGQTDDELYDALYDMGYDFGELGSDDFDEEGFADAATNLGYRYDDKNKVWNHRDTMGDSETSKSTPKINSKNWKPDEDGKMSNDAADDVRNYLNDVLGVDGVAEVDYNTGNIQYSLADGENSIFVGNEGGKYNVSFEGPTMDIDKITQSYKSFKNAKEALQYAGELAKANKKGLEQKQESTKLTSMIKK
jgi:hypothetical protein